MHCSYRSSRPYWKATARMRSREAGRFRYIGGNVKSRFTLDMSAALEARKSLLDAKKMGWPEFRRVWIALLQQTVQAYGACGRARQKPLTESEAAERVDRAYAGFADHRAAADAWRMRFRVSRQKALEGPPPQKRRRGPRRSPEEVEETRAARAALRARRCAERAARLLDRERRRLIRASLAVETAIHEAAREEEARARAALMQRRRSDLLRKRERWRWMRDPSRTTEELLHGPPL
mmetsp:Transcript_111675/g.320840  ORF Transcript_111675/g.320840 Transcript_111675/m.320840 type:complete len:236 (-) Transcript_111675:143-850(-)